MVELPPWPVMAGITLARVSLAIVFLYVVIPFFVFPRLPGADPPTLVQRAIWMIFISTVIVHLLVVLRLYEAIVFLVLMVILAARPYLPASKRKHLHRIGAGLAGWFFDLIDRRAALPRWSDFVPRPFSRPLDRLTVARTNPWSLAGWSIFLVVLATAAWMLFADAFRTPAPALSDAPVTLAWMKYMENNLLYRDEVYPRGMYVFLSLVKKFTAANSVEVLDLTGPLVGWLILLSLIFFVFKTTGSLGAATVAALLYGTLPGLQPMAFDRHVAHNSQEFGLIFSLPAAWYAYSYLARGNPPDRATAAAAAGVTAFTHPVSTLLAASAMGASGLAALLERGLPAWRRLPGLIGWTAAAALIAAAPMALALAAGQNWHGSSIQYLKDGPAAAPPPPDPLVLGASALALVLASAALILFRTARTPAKQDLWARRSAAAAMAAVSMLLYLLPSFGLHLGALADRVGEIAALGLAVTAALAWSSLESALKLLPPGLARALPAVLIVPLVAGAWYLYPPEPARPYRYYSDQLIMQYLRADRSFTSGQWTLVMGNTGYALALGRAYHQYQDDFIGMAAQMPLHAEGWIERGKALGFGITPNYLLAVEKIVPLAPFEPPENALPRLQAAARLREWIDQNRDRLRLEKIFDGEQVAVWRLALPVKTSPEDAFRTVQPAPGSLRR